MIAIKDKEVLAIMRNIEKDESAKDTQAFSRLILGAKASLVNQNVLEYLKNKYEVKLYMRQDGENAKK